MSRLLDFLGNPLGDDAAATMVFLQGGPFNGDRGSIKGQAPQVIACVPSPDGTESVWHDLDEADRVGDLPRHACFYVLVHTQPARSGMTAALYWHAGYRRPTRREMRHAHNDFERALRSRAAVFGGSNPTERDV